MSQTWPGHPPGTLVSLTESVVDTGAVPILVDGTVLLALAGLTSLQAPSSPVAEFRLFAGDCGSYILDDTSHLSEQRCLVDALRKGTRAELLVVQPTIDAGPILFHYRVVDRRVVEVVEDSTRDTYGGGHLKTFRCSTVVTGAGMPERSSCAKVQNLPSPGELDTWMW